MVALKLFFTGFFLIDLLMHAGWPVWPLLGISVLALALILERAWFLRTAHIAPADAIEPVLTQCQHALPTQQQSSAMAQSSLLGELLASGIERLRSQPLISDNQLRQGLELEGRLACARMEKHLPALATLASVATLMGLLGTVMGMIEIFAAQTSSAQQPAQLVQHCVGLDGLDSQLAGLALAAQPCRSAHHAPRGRLRTPGATTATAAKATLSTP
jgi:biopolymer transport protein ExbB